jgi:hypothetical protein
MRQEGMKMDDIKVAFSEASPMADNVTNSGLGKKSVRTSFSTGKKRIGGTRL